MNEATHGFSISIQLFSAFLDQCLLMHSGVVAIHSFWHLVARHHNLSPSESASASLLILTTCSLPMLLVAFSCHRCCL